MLDTPRESSKIFPEGGGRQAPMAITPAVIKIGGGSYQNSSERRGSDSETGRGWDEGERERIQSNPDHYD